MADLDDHHEDDLVPDFVDDPVVPAANPVQVTPTLKLDASHGAWVVGKLLGPVKNARLIVLGEVPQFSQGNPSDLDTVSHLQAQFLPCLFDGNRLVTPIRQPPQGLLEVHLVFQFLQ